MAKHLVFLCFSGLLFSLSSAAESQCGISQVVPSHIRIVGGFEARPHQFPWMVKVETEADRRIGHSTAGTPVKHFQCGGSLLAPQWVLTAGHCFDNTNEDYVANLAGTMVVLGAHNLSDHSEAGVIHAKTEHVYVHEGFSKKTIEHTLVVENDITLIKLAEPIDLSKHQGHIAPICLPEVGQSVSKSECQIVGWGRISSQTRNHGPLKYADVNLLSATECNVHRNNRIPLNDMNVCAGYRNHHTCRGDSGGPLQCKNAQGHWVMVGSDSYGPSICESNVPSVFVNIEKHLAWIKKTMASH